MAIAVCSDIHGNLRNLQNMLNRLRDEGILEVWCSGDVVDFGSASEDKACLRMLSQLNAKTTQGNHDFSASHLRNYVVATKQELQFDSTLGRMPKSVIQGSVMMAHSFPAQDEEIRDITQAERAFSRLQERHPEVKTCFVGHYHSPVAFCYNPRTRECSEEKRSVFFLDGSLLYLINPGSLGRNPEGNYLLFHPEKKKIERRQLYD